MALRMVFCGEGAKAAKVIEVAATFMKQDTILGTAQGTVNAISAGSSKTAELMTTDKIRGYDTLKLETGACF